MAHVTINGNTLDPAAMAAETSGPASSLPSAYVLVQARAPLHRSEKAALARAGAAIHEYAGNSSYLCACKPDRLQAVRALPFVSFAGAYHPDFKFHAGLRQRIADSAASGLSARHKVDVVLHGNIKSSGAALIARIAAAAHVDPASIRPARRKLRVEVEERYLAALSAIDAVRHVEAVPSLGLFNNVARTIVGAEVMVNGTSYEGEGEIVVVNDTGFDTGSATDAHPAFAGRVVKLVALGRPGLADDPVGHGTHVAGSVLGDGHSDAMGGKIQGIAPKARLIVQSLLAGDSSLGGVPADLHDLFAPTYEEDGARIQSNSWGGDDVGGHYSQNSREIDEFVWKHPDCVLLFAAGNFGLDTNGDGVVDSGSLVSHAAAKNCITVGASENARAKFGKSYNAWNPKKWQAAPIAPDNIADNADGMDAQSSRGPTRENRFKPDLVAPGTIILSTRSRQMAAGTVEQFPSPDPAFMFSSGTSMATPLVAGCAAVLREILVKNGTPAPSAALVKALLINGAVPLKGQYMPSEAGDSPNNSSGWGRVNLAAAVIATGLNQRAGFSEFKPLKQGTETSFSLDIAAASTLKITLVWTDPPGAALQNDLDLIVTAANGEERHGNMGASADFDHSNNVEQVLWVNMPPGTAEVSVRAFHITRFAQPGACVWRIDPVSAQG